MLENSDFEQNYWSRTATGNLCLIQHNRILSRRSSVQKSI